MEKRAAGEQLKDVEREMLVEAGRGGIEHGLNGGSQVESVEWRRLERTKGD